MKYALDILKSTQVKSNTCRVFFKKTRQYQKHIMKNAGYDAISLIGVKHKIELKPNPPNQSHSI